jgi:hypothetical protein
MTDKKCEKAEKNTDWVLLGLGLGLFGGSIWLGVVADILGTKHPSFGNLAVYQEVSLFTVFIIFGALLLLVGMPILMTMLSEKKFLGFFLLMVFAVPLIGTSSYSILNEKLDSSDAQLFVGVVVGKRAVGSKSAVISCKYRQTTARKFLNFPLRTKIIKQALKEITSCLSSIKATLEGTG